MDPISWSVYHTGPVSRDGRPWRIRLTYFSFPASRRQPMGHLGQLLRTPLVRRNDYESSSQKFLLPGPQKLLTYSSQ
jgi:hypothetical protein